MAWSGVFHSCWFEFMPSLCPHPFGMANRNFYSTFIALTSTIDSWECRKGHNVHHSMQYFAVLLITTYHTDMNLRHEKTLYVHLKRQTCRWQIDQWGLQMHEEMLSLANWNPPLHGSTRRATQQPQNLTGLIGSFIIKALHQSWLKLPALLWSWS